MLQSNLPRDADDDVQRLGWCRLVLYCRPLLWASFVLLHLLCFNGLWRVGLDSALYRGIGHSLASGQGYTFNGAANDFAYPGLPGILAGLEVVFGPSAVPGIVLVNLCSLASLWIIEKLVRLHASPWTALTVTCGVAFNGWFLPSSQELMTDTPFLLGVVTVLYGWERYRRSTNRHDAIGPVITLVLGLAFALVMRPTGWVLVASWAMYCTLKLIWPRAGVRRTPYLLGIATVSLVVLAVAWLDAGRLILGGEYKVEFVHRLSELPTLVSPHRIAGIAHDVNNAFFGQTMGPPVVAVIVALGLLSTLVLIVRRNLLWVLPVLVMLGVALVASSVPRYYLFVLPTLWLAWVKFWELVTKVTPRAWKQPVLVAGVMFPVVMNSGRLWGIVSEQRAPDVAALTKGVDRETAFYADYRDGTIPRLRSIAAMVKQHVGPGDIVVAPDANIVSYYSGRRVVGERQILFNKAVRKAPQFVHDFNASGNVYFVFPWQSYKNDPQVMQMIKKRIIVPMQVIARQGKDYLAKATVVIPPAGMNWINYHANSRHSADYVPSTTPSTQKVVKKKPTTKKATTHPTTKKVKKPTTKPTTKKAVKKQPTTKKAPTKPVKKKKPAPTTTTSKKKKKPATMPVGQSGVDPSDHLAAVLAPRVCASHLLQVECSSGAASNNVMLSVLAKHLAPIARPSTFVWRQILRSEYLPQNDAVAATRTDSGPSFPFIPSLFKPSSAS
ncbi:MAG: hypothetical protein QM770_03935 [Tepidisphaeraceae bacterium]